MSHTPNLRINGPSPGMLAGIDDGGDYALIDSENRVIGEAYHKIGVGVRADALANAQLWAAAAELKAALEAIVEAGWLCTEQPRAMYCADIAKIALAKIEPCPTGATGDANRDDAAV